MLLWCYKLLYNNLGSKKYYMSLEEDTIIMEKLFSNNTPQSFKELKEFKANGLKQIAMDMKMPAAKIVSRWGMIIKPLLMENLYGMSINNA